MPKSLRQKVLKPKHGYKYLHDQLNKWRLSGRAEELRRRTCRRLKSREVTLLVFTTLLTEIGDTPAGGRAAALPAQLQRLAGAAREHRQPEDEFTPIIQDTVYPK